MTIYPYGKPKNLSMKWQYAAIDLPVPDRLIEDEDKREWSSYLDCLSPAQQLRKAAQATDQFIALLDKAPADLTLLSEREQILVFSKWMAMTFAANMVSTRLQFCEGEGRKSKEYPTDMDCNFSRIIDFLSSVNSPDVKEWEKRRERHHFYSNEEDTPFSKLLTHGYNTFANNENAKKSPPPLDAPPIGLEKDVNVNKPLKVKPLTPK
ncbi:MAG: hypothetical protein ACAH80_15880 [Alphaproteobacteria bacterium]